MGAKSDQSFDNYFKDITSKIYVLTGLLLMSGLIIDSVVYVITKNPDLVPFNIVAFSICFLSLLLFKLKRISIKFGFILIVYPIMLNSISSEIYMPLHKDAIYLFLRDSSLFAFLIPLASFIINKYHSFIVISLYSIFALFYTYYTQDKFLADNIYTILVVGIGYSFCIYYFVLLLEKSMLDRALRQEEIEKQKEEIESQKNQLEHHKNNLEKLVIERTADLEYAKSKSQVSERLKIAFLENMSHEIRTPLNAIVGFSNLLDEEELTDEDKKNYINTIVTNSDVLLDLFNKILELSTFDIGEVVLEENTFNLYELVNEIYKSFCPTNVPFRSKGVRFILNKDNIDKSLEITSDSSRLSQILRNLVTNALKHTEKGSVEMGYDIFTEQNIIKFYVKDTGIGISNEDQEIIFDRFTKIEKPKSKLYRGVGLGLSISKSLVELLGGIITVKSHEGVGSTFSFSIPLRKKDIS